MSKLAINGGPKIRTEPFPKQLSIDHNEEESVLEVLKSKRLSAYRGTWGDNFYGGPKIQELEEVIVDKFGYPGVQAIPCNSATSGLFIACKAIGLEPGDEVIVTPWSMTCSATVPLWFGATPVFADIEEDYYCLDPESIKKKVTEKTKAIIVVDLFGQPANYKKIREIADEYGIWIIEDAAQAIGSKSGITRAGFLGDIGVFSFTQGKILTAGEGGCIVTSSDNLALDCRLIMNHGESVLNEGYDNLIRKVDDSCLGLNLRLTEIQAAIIIEQLKKLDDIIAHRNEISRILRNGLLQIPPIFDGSEIREDCTHSYYVQAFKYIQQIDKTHRDVFIDAVKAELAPELGRESEGVPIGCGYIKPIYLMPIFQNMGILTEALYEQGTCPVAERLWRDELFLHRFCGFPLNRQDIQDIVDAFVKVWENRDELR